MIPHKCNYPGKNGLEKNYCRSDCHLNNLPISSINLLDYRFLISSQDDSGRLIYIYQEMTSSLHSCHFLFLFWCKAVTSSSLQQS